MTAHAVCSRNAGLSNAAAAMAAVFFFSLTILPLAALADSARIEELDLPLAKGGQRMTGIMGLAVDGKNNKIALVKPGMWSEIPQKSRGIDGRRGFTAPTKGFALTAAASTSWGVYVYDALGNKLMGKRKEEYVLPAVVQGAGGLAFYQGHIFLSDAGRNEIYKIKLNRGKAQVVQTTQTSSPVNGLAANSKGLFGAAGTKLIHFEDSLAVKKVYSLGIDVDGLTALSDTDFMASRSAGSKLYRISIASRR